MIEMHEVDSSNIESVGYQSSSEELHVRFRSGRTYAYTGVPENVFLELLSAPSKGSYFNRVIKPSYPMMDV